LSVFDLLVYFSVFCLDLRSNLLTLFKYLISLVAFISNVFLHLCTFDRGSEISFLNLMRFHNSELVTQVASIKYGSTYISQLHLFSKLLLLCVEHGCSIDRIYVFWAWAE